ncbi:MAG: amidophosphoribosyltransferase [Actinobacteria bacterium]|nr:amidophosphoribosyltransferase [Actinomycetota bacterium]MCL6104032.1 amidophosphoribosyltransferase [Actinomycetota bacterium]
MKEACGVFGIYLPQTSNVPETTVAQLVFDGLYALQHRGQEAAGMAVSDGDIITVVKDLGLVSKVFDEKVLSGLVGSLAIGHVRYSTSGLHDWYSAQPTYRSTGVAGFAMGHNGNLTNTDELAARAGMLPGMVVSDSDVLAELISQALSAELISDGYADSMYSDFQPFQTACLKVMPLLQGAFSLLLMDVNHLIGIRDPNGFRPLCLGSFPKGHFCEGGWVMASETPALDVVGAEFVREIEPGEMVIISEDGVQSLAAFEAKRLDPRLCVFEFIYFARPDSILYGKEVHGTRRRMGELLAEEAFVDADLVMGVPDSGIPAAEGYSRRSGIPYGQGLVKNRYIGRTFIAPTQTARGMGVRRKFNPLKENIMSKRLVVVDDSIVRGTTSRALVGMLKEAGAKEVHLRISSPPLRWPCFYGIDLPTREELLAAPQSIDEICRYLGADSVAYLSWEKLLEAVGIDGAGFCNACLSGVYPTDILEVPSDVQVSVMVPSDGYV